MYKRNFNKSLIFIIFNIFISVKTENEITDNNFEKSEKLKYEDVYYQIKNDDPYVDNFRKVAFLDLKNINNYLLEKQLTIEESKKFLNYINKQIFDSNKDYYKFLNYKNKEEDLENKNNYIKNENEKGSMDVFQIVNLERFKTVELLSCFTKIIYGENHINNKYENMAEIFTESISLKNYIFNPDFINKNKENERFFVLKNLLDEKNKNITEKKIKLFNEINKDVNDIFYENISLKFYLNTFFIEQLNGESNNKIKGNTLYSKIEKFFKENYEELKNFSAKDFFEKFIETDEEIKSNKTIKVKDLVNYINNSEESSKEILKEAFYAYLLENNSEKIKLNFQKKINEKEFLSLIDSEKEKYSFSEKLESIFKNFLFSNLTNKFLTKNKVLFVEKMKKLIINFEDFFNDKNFLYKILNKNDANSIIAVLLKIKEVSGGFEDKNTENFLKKISSKKNEEYNYFSLMKNNKNFMINFFKTIYSEMASLMVPLILLKEKNDFICIPEYDSEQDCKLKFKGLKNPLNFLAGKDKKLVEINLYENGEKKQFSINELLMISAMTGSGKTMFMNTIANSILTSNVFGFSFGEMFSLKKKGYHLPINLTNMNSNLVGKLSNNQHEYLSIKILSEFIKDYLEKKNLNLWVFGDEVGSTTTSVFAKNMVKEILSELNKKEIVKIFVTHQKDVISEVFKTFKDDVSYYTTTAVIKDKKGKILLENKNLGFEKIDKKIFDKEKTEKECCKKVCIENNNTLIVLDGDSKDFKDRNIRELDFLKLDSDSYYEDFFTDEIKFKKTLLISIDDNKLLKVELNKEKDEKTGKYYITSNIVNEFENKNGQKVYNLFNIDEYNLECILGNFEKVEGEDGGLIQYSINRVIEYLERKRKEKEFASLVTLFINKDNLMGSIPYMLGKKS